MICLEESVGLEARVGLSDCPVLLDFVVGQAVVLEL
jgi:hypothetical protein